MWHHLVLLVACIDDLGSIPTMLCLLYRSDSLAGIKRASGATALLQVHLELLTDLTE